VTPYLSACTIPSRQVAMTFLHRIAHSIAAVVRGIVQGLTLGFDALVGPVGRLSDKIEAHLLNRTHLLRAHYAAPRRRDAIHDRFEAETRS